MPLVENRYAQALFDLSEANVDIFKQDFKEFLDIYNTDLNLKGFLLDPRIKVDDKQKVTSNILKGRINDYLLNFILLLIVKQRIKFIPQMYEQFVRLADAKANILELKIISAEPLEDKQIDAIKQKFGIKYKASSVKALNTIDTSLIGGVKVIIGDQVYDGSVKGRIESLMKLVEVI